MLNNRLRGRGDFRRVHQPLDPIDLILAKTREDAGLDVKPPRLDSVEEFLTFQPKLFRQLMDARGQRRLLLNGPRPPKDRASSIGMVNLSDRSRRTQFYRKESPRLVASSELRKEGVSWNSVTMTIAAPKRPHWWLMTIMAPSIRGKDRRA